jgi:hypothetical protein
MNIRMWGFALSLTMTGVATAQVPPPAQPPPPPSRDQPGPPIVLGPENPPPPPASEPIASPHKEEPQADTGRPTGLAFGIGLGYVFPTSLQTPNTTSVRLRLPTGLTFEPQLVFATTSTDVDTGTSVTNKQNEVTLGTLVRYPLKVHNKVDLEVVGSVALSNRVTDPNGDNNTQTVTTFALGYGVAMAYWLSPHWNLSLTASNPLFSYTRTRQEMAVDLVTVNKSTTIGLVFDPQVALMIHLYN